MSFFHDVDVRFILDSNIKVSNTEVLVYRIG